MPEFLVVAEADADLRIVSSLADRIFIDEGPEWVNASLLPTLREWSGLEPSTSYTRWADIRDLSVKYKLPRYLGHVEGKPQGVDCAQSRKAIKLAIMMQTTRKIA